MKVCSQCGSTYSDRIDFCFHDGSVLNAGAVAEPVEPAGLPTPTMGRFGGFSGLDLPERPLPPTFREGDLTPVPLKPMRLPPPQRVVQSPLLEMPPPPVAGDTLIPIEDTEEVPPPGTPPASARTIQPPSSPRRGDGVPVWMWAVGLGAAGLAVAAGAVFALGGVGLLSAIGVAPEKADRGLAAVAPADDDRFPAAPPPADLDKFPEPPVEVGLINSADSDAVAEVESDSDTTGTDDSGNAELDPPDPDGALVAGTVAPAPGEAGAVDGGGPVAGDAATSGDAATTGGGTADPGTAAASSGTADPDSGKAAPASSTSKPTDEAPNPWGAVDPKPAADEKIDVLVLMEGTGEGIRLFIDGVETRGSFPHSVKLTPGMHRFKVQSTSGQSYEIGKTVRKDADRAAQVQLIPPG